MSKDIKILNGFGVGREPGKPRKKMNKDEPEIIFVCFSDFPKKYPTK